MSDQRLASSQRANPYLSPNQQDLLLRALESQSSNRDTNPPGIKRSSSDFDNASTNMSALNGDTLFMSPQNAELDSSYLDYTPDVDYLDGGESFDFENADLGGDMIGALPGSGAGASKDDVTTTNGDGHEKRKSPDEGNDSEGGDAKRQETQEGEKGAKKPGRKPLTSEPTTKRKAQNRAAQRAFRERKEKHLKDLETKVSELTKSSEADKHENGLLKAQVERLQVELREYRKRLSLNSAVSRSPPMSASAGGQQRSSSGPSFNGGFQFDFPKFGALPGSQFFSNQSNGSKSGVMTRDSLTPPISQSPTAMSGQAQQSQNKSRQNSAGRSMSPQSNGSNAASPAQFANMNATFAPYSTNNNMHGFASTLPQMTGGSDPFGDLFSPSILKGTNVNGYFENSQPSGKSQAGTDNGGDSTSGLNRVFQFNGGSNVSDSTSPSASSLSQWNANGTSNSSCGTSPEPSHDSPAVKDKQSDSFSTNVNTQQSSGNSAAGNTNTGGFGTTFGFDNADYSAPSMGTFDPVLFGDYRDNNDGLTGGGDFSGGFFDDALNSAPFDYGSPSNLFGILQSPEQTQASLNVNSAAKNTHPAPSKALMAEIEKARDGGDDDYGLPNTQPKKHQNGQLISCNNIWNQLQSNPDFQEGKFDLDNLCSELRAKARCSESGVMVDQNHVDAAFKKLGQKDASGKLVDAPPLMFEQSSWDNVLKKLQKGSN